MTTTMTKRTRTRQDILNRIDKLKIKPIENAKLIKKWERILRNFDKLNV